jgi:hypothetical protein
MNGRYEWQNIYFELKLRSHFVHNAFSMKQVSVSLKCLVSFLIPQKARNTSCNIHDNLYASNMVWLKIILSINLELHICNMVYELHICNMVNVLWEFQQTSPSNYMIICCFKYLTNRFSSLLVTKQTWKKLIYVYAILDFSTLFHSRTTEATLADSWNFPAPFWRSSSRKPSSLARIHF